MTSITGKVSLVLPNFPSPPHTTSSGRDVFLQSLDIQDSKMLRGVIVVRNMSYQKRLVVRFTTDDWATISEVSAEYSQALEGGAFDQWVFRIKLDDMLARIEEKKMMLAVKYTVDGRDIWDNADGQNYLVQFKKEVPPPPKSFQKSFQPTGKTASAYSWAVTTAGQASERMADLRKVLDRLVQEDTVDVTLAGPPKERSLANRYDFGASLKQHPGRTSSMENVPTLKDTRPYFHPVTTTSLNSAVPATASIETLPAQPRYARHEVNGIHHTDYAFAPPTNGRLPYPLQSGSTSPPRRDSDSDAAQRTDRFNSFPPSRWDGSAVSPNTPRLFDDTFSSPYLTRPAQHGNVDFALGVSPRSSSPLDSRTSAFSNGRRPRSPPPALTSPNSSTPSSSNDSSYASPRSPVRSGSPDAAMMATLQGKSDPSTFFALPRPNDRHSYASFLDKVRLFRW
jgi:hypothetical protein